MKIPNAYTACESYLGRTIAVEAKSGFYWVFEADGSKWNNNFGDRAQARRAIDFAEECEGEGE